ncbi:MAG TPA: hypothetical protein DEQ73_04695 [Phycisphaerales bacterium]|nr:hypothetical protein [Phycisphaerales bacterium]
MIRTTFAAAALAVVSTANADLVIDSALGTTLDVSHSVGSGDLTSYMVIDFGATGGDSVAFSYSWSGPTMATSNDMIEAIVAAGFLSWEYTDYSFGRAVDNFSYGDMTGDANFFWGLSLGDVVDPGVEWVGSPVGLSDNLLSNNSLEGWYNGFNEDYSTIPPALPLVPAPGVMTALMLVAGQSRRRRPNC